MDGKTTGDASRVPEQEHAGGAGPLPAAARAGGQGGGRVPGERRPRLRAGISYTLLGPAFVAAIAYVDPGNFATNVQAGAVFGPLLLWVVVSANLVAMLLQYLSAKLGLATGASLAELCRTRYRRPVVRGLWVQAELVVVMTDLAEVVGGAVALNILFGLPLPAGGVVIGLASLVLMPMSGGGKRRFEVAMALCLALLLGAFLGQVLGTGGSWGPAAGGLVPRIGGGESLLLAGGIVGATVMPHVIYLHSALTSDRFSLELENGRHDVPVRRRLLRHVRADVLVAMGLAGAVNAALLISASSLFHAHAPGAGGSLAAAHHAYAALAGQGAAWAFALALLVSGLAGTSVGMYAGQVVMGGFLRRRIPVLLRRVLTVAPALAVLSSGMSPTRALVVSQIVLSFGIPFALVPLVALTRDRAVMGPWVNRRATTAAAVAVSVVVVALNASLLVSLV
ncbi:Nramp family divalent metal transporter [Streptomyces sp. NPDC047002]|uniref:Nramp family divalent metal transporter n=1 Tax=Streptomyces sp. NPDC047002 TaxID=3155475 RepID=UPI003454D35D